MCLLKIHSKTKSFKNISVLKHLPVYSTRNKGDIRNKRTGKEYENYSASLEVSTAEWDSFTEQIKDAIQFLKLYERDLTILLNHSADSEAYLDFPLWSRLSDDIVNQNDHLPKELIHLAGRIGLGIEVSKYSRDAFDHYEA